VKFSVPFLRLFFGVVSGGCFILWGLFSFVLDPSFFLRLVHTEEIEWHSMYVNLGSHLGSGLLCVGALFLIAALFFETFKALYVALLRMPAKYFLAIILGIQALVCCAWLFAFPADVWADGITYHRLAIGLAHGAGYIGEDGQPTAYYPIGYPLLLSFFYRVFGTSLMVGKVANVGMVLALMFVWYRIARNVWNEAAARTLLVLLVGSLSIVSYVSILFSEIAFLFFFSLAILGAVESLDGQFSFRRLLFFGIMTGIAALIRPVALLLPLAYGIASLRKEGGRRNIAAHVALLYALAILVLLPNIVRNFSVFGSFVPVSTNGGINFWIGNNPGATGYYMSPAAAHLTGNEVEQSRQGYAQGMEWITSHPGSAAVVFLKKFFHLYHRDDQGILFSIVRTVRAPAWTLAVAAIILDTIAYYLIFLLAMGHVIRKRHFLSAAEYFFILLCLLMTGFHLLYFGAHRFHFPVNPIIMGLAAAGIARTLDSQPPREHPRS